MFHYRIDRKQQIEGERDLDEPDRAGGKGNAPHGGSLYVGGLRTETRPQEFEKTSITSHPLLPSRSPRTLVRPKSPLLPREIGFLAALLLQPNDATVPNTNLIYIVPSRRIEPFHFMVEFPPNQTGSREGNNYPMSTCFQ